MWKEFLMELHSFEINSDLCEYVSLQTHNVKWSHNHIPLDQQLIWTHWALVTFKSHQNIFQNHDGGIIQSLSRKTAVSKCHLKLQCVGFLWHSDWMSYPASTAAAKKKKQNKKIKKTCKWPSLWPVLCLFILGYCRNMKTQHSELCGRGNHSKVKKAKQLLSTGDYTLVKTWL